jgi:ribosomal protein S18 acetylase RimI-like enzyme
VIRTIEELSLNAWPAWQTLLVGGWVVRFAGGYTRRANSVIPLYPVQGDVDQQIAACETLYRAQDLPVIFKMTSACTPPDLDERLAARGYAFDAHTSVQVLDLGDTRFAPPENLTLNTSPDADWQAAFQRMHHLEGEAALRHARILEQILPQTGYATLAVGSQVMGTPSGARYPRHTQEVSAACGLGVLQDGYLGLFDIITAEDQRRRGYGRQIMAGLLAWGKGQGAHTAYLQVMLNNSPALALYAGLGFREIYRYWYRVKP